MTRNPHVVGLVGNDVVIDARVRKAAAAAAAAGFKSTIVCYAPSGPKRETRMGNVNVIRVPVPFPAHIKNGRVPPRLRPFNGAELVMRRAGPRNHLLARARWLLGEVEDPAITGMHRIVSTILLMWVRISLKLRHETFRLRRRAHIEMDRIVRRFNRTRVRTTSRLFRPLRDGVPNIADYEVAFGPIIEELRPDLIHAHDYHMIGIAVTAARSLRRRGHTTKVLYDAHEWIEGLSYPPQTLRGWLKLERRFIGHVDAVTGVSPEQTTQLRKKYQLKSTPDVILNAPVTAGAAPPVTDIRKELGLSGSILTYHGNIFLERGLSTVIDALPLLDRDVHLAVLAPKDNPLVAEVESHASNRGVADRVHILSYVPAYQLPAYLSTADVAVVPYLPTGNNDIALPNKLFEAVQAGLPLLVSDMRSMSALVTELQIGDVFQAGNVEDLATKAKGILANPHQYRSHITAELKRELSWDTQAERLTSIYHRLLGTAAMPHLQVTVSDVTEGVGALDQSRRTRVAIGPRNMAGQAFSIAAAVQAHLGIPAVSFSMEKPIYQFPIHIQIGDGQWRDPGWQASQRRLLGDGFTHVIAESGTGLLGSLNGGFIDDQLDILLEEGLQVAVLLHGSEVRDPRRHRQLPYSPYASTDKLTRTLEDAQARLMGHLEGLDLPIYVTTPDLLEDIEATWLPVVVDTEKWRALKPAFASEVPTVLHLPSNSLLKGSHYFDPVLSRLDAEGRIHYLRPEGAAAAEVPWLIEQSDIVIDQVVIGAYGLMSVQALAAGRLSVANIRDISFLRSECPIVHADPGSFGEVFDDLLHDPTTWLQRAELGRRFVEKHHNGSATAEVLKSFLNLT